MFDSGYKYIYDKYNDVYRYVPCAADVAGLCVSTSNNSETWFSPAGYNRGQVRNATKLAYSPKQAERDRLYTDRINPIVAFPGQGIVLFGDKTALASPSAFDRINVRRLFVELEKNIANFSKYQLFEINDELTRSGFRSAIEPYLRGVQGRRGIYDFLVVCDTTNNTPDVIDRNELVAEIFIKPARTINYITITFVATRTGVSFNELTN
jgi:phage tail sheath protein FI